MNASIENNPLLVLFYLAPVLLLFLWQYFRSRQRSRRNAKIVVENQEVGMTAPVSLHPKIDPSVCIGCGSCVAACPEGKVLGLVYGKAELIHPDNCIGHGACAKACPVGGIELVFGTEKRGIDIPLVNEDFETTTPGIYLAGEIGGMGLVRNAMTQGRQAIEAITNRKRQINYPYDVFIVGAGPAGIAASVTAKHYGLKYRTIEQESFGGTVAHFPRGKLVMTQPVELPGVGKMKLGEIRKEALLKKWDALRQQTGIEVQYEERLESVTPLDPGFSIKTNKGEFQSSTLLLAIGRRGTPRKLGVKGEDLAKVVYRLVDPAQYRASHVLVVGGGDSAIEAAMAVANESDTQVTLSYRGEFFNRIKAKNRERLQEMVDRQRLNVLYSSTVKEIGRDFVLIEQQGKTQQIHNDAVIISAGGVLPSLMLREMGIEIETKYGVA